MKARVIETGKIVDVVANGNYYDTTDNKERYYSYELDFNDTHDYWTRLEHQYAGMAMQGLLSNERCWEENPDKIAEVAICYAKELVKGIRIERSN